MGHKKSIAAVGLWPYLRAEQTIRTTNQQQPALGTAQQWEGDLSIRTSVRPVSAREFLYTWTCIGWLQAKPSQESVHLPSTPEPNGTPDAELHAFQL